jgi:hypothetical protein
VTSFLGQVFGPDHFGLEGLMTILVTSLAFGLAVVGALLLASGGRRDIGLRLAYALIPLAGLGLFLAEAEHSLNLLAQAGFAAARFLPWLRSLVIAVGAAWSLALALKARPIVGLHSAGGALTSAALIGGLALAYLNAPSALP